MAVRFILGRFGSGKSQWCFEQIVRSLKERPIGPPIYWIVPRQATFQTERWLSCASGLGGYFRVRVVSFADLGREILRECGDSAYQPVSDTGRRMILGHLLRQAQKDLKFFGGVAKHGGTPKEIDETFSELERCGLTAVDLTAMLDGDANAGGVGGGGALAKKIADLSLLWDRYSKFLGQDRLDPQQRQEEALEMLGECRSLKTADVYVDSFYDFTAYERKILAKLSVACSSMSITLAVDPDADLVGNAHLLANEMSLLHRTEQAYRKLYFAINEAGGNILLPLKLTKPVRFANGALAALSQLDLNSPRKAEDSDAEAIVLCEAADDRAEVDLAARWIVREVSQGKRYRDLAVLMRTEDDYRELIAESFREHRIPFFVDRRRSAAHHPLLRLLRAAVGVARQNWLSETVLAAIRTDLLDLTASEADTLENYVLEHGVRNALWTRTEPWTAGKSQTSVFAAKQNAADAHPISAADYADGLRRRVLEKLQPFVSAVRRHQPISMREMAKAVFDLLERCGVRAKLVVWMSEASQRGDLEEEAEHDRVWRAVGELFEEMVTLFGDEPIGLDDFSAILDAAMESFDLALAPPAVDQVLVGSVDRTRTAAIRGCVVLGLSEGQFPRRTREGTIFSDADRRELSQRKIELEDDSRRRLLDEEFLGAVAMSRASERLLLTRPVSAEKESEIAPSTLWLAVTAMFPHLRVYPAATASADDLSRVSTPRQLVGGLMQWIRQGPKATDDWAGVYNWFVKFSAGENLIAIEEARCQGWPALSYENHAELDRELAERMFQSPLTVGPRELETFRACPFQHFARYGLKLGARPMREVSGLDLSQLYHRSLHELAAELVKVGANWADLSDQQITQRARLSAARVGKTLRNELMLSSGRNKYQLDRVRRMLELVMHAQRAAAERGKFRPAAVNLRFGNRGGAPRAKDAESACEFPALKVTTPKSRQVEVCAGIDRVDISHEGFAYAIDYRMSNVGMDAGKVFHGLELALLTQLLLLEENHAAIFATPATAAGAFNVAVTRSISSGDPTDAIGPDNPEFHLRVKPRGIFDERIEQLLDAQAAGQSSGVVAVKRKKDGGLTSHGQHDIASPQQLANLLALTRKRIGEIADGILDGGIAVKPARVGDESPCPSCGLQAVCRIETAPGMYVNLPGMNRTELLERAGGEQA